MTYSSNETSYKPRELFHAFKSILECAIGKLNLNNVQENSSEFIGYKLGHVAEFYNIQANELFER